MGFPLRSVGLPLAATLLLSACGGCASTAPHKTAAVETAAGTTSPPGTARPDPPPSPSASPRSGETPFLEPGSAGPDAGAADGSPGDGPSATSELLAAEIATVGWDGITDSPIVLLREASTGRVVPIWVGVAEARAIAAALLGVEYPRPMTHDLMADLVGKLDARLEEVRIHDVRDGTYYGMLQLRVAGKLDPLMVDTRPSDGLALALRTGAAIRLSRTVLDQTPDYEFLAPEAGEQVVRALGLTVVAPSAELRQEFSLPERNGVVVLTVSGEAARKGLRRGDLIVAVNGAVPEAPVDLLTAVRETPAGKPIRVTYLRAGEESEVDLRPESAAARGPRQVA
jgi:bifunctional DNase/RNase